mmetsp:Transcript_54/g.99  ORF Transcript_54/g.99 Transcript_54/m.99 type:complete len:355 (+) Transcript_54:680-1744(+)
MAHKGDATQRAAPSAGGREPHVQLVGNLLGQACSLCAQVVVGAVLVAGREEIQGLRIDHEHVIPDQAQVQGVAQEAMHKHEHVRRRGRRGRSGRVSHHRVPYAPRPHLPTSARCLFAAVQASRLKLIRAHVSKDAHHWLLLWPLLQVMLLDWHLVRPVLPAHLLQLAAVRAHVRLLQLRVVLQPLDGLGAVSRHARPHSNRDVVLMHPGRAALLRSIQARTRGALPLAAHRHAHLQVQPGRGLDHPGLPVLIALNLPSRLKQAGELGVRGLVRLQESQPQRVHLDHGGVHLLVQALQGGGVVATVQELGGALIQNVPSGPQLPRAKVHGLRRTVARRAGVVPVPLPRKLHGAPS